MKFTFGKVVRDMVLNDGTYWTHTFECEGSMVHLLRTEQTVGKKLPQNKTPGLTRNKTNSSCGKCNSKTKGATIHHWLGIRWIGYPWPLRMRNLRRRYEGCGCILKLKVASGLLRNTFQQIRSA